jgi:hypothetical protein
LRIGIHTELAGLHSVGWSCPATWSTMLLTLSPEPIASVST